MLRSRSGRPSLIGSAARTAGRTAVIVGTATAVSGAMAGSRQPQAAAPQAAQPVAQSVVIAPTDDKVTQLQKLAELQKTGILTEEEFATLKAQILAS